MCLSFIALVRKDPNRADRDDLLKEVAATRGKLFQLASLNDVNYAAWIHLLDAEVADLSGDWLTAGKSYEDAVDHSQKYGFALEEAQAYELYGGALARRGLKKPAQNMFLDCIAAYRRISAFGKCEQVKQVHLSDLQRSVVVSKADAVTQTDGTDTGNMTFDLRTKEDQSQ